MNSPEETNTGPVIRDLRRIDPATGQVRDPGQEQRGKRPGRHAASKPGGTPGNGTSGSGAHRASQPEAPEAQAAGDRAAGAGGPGPDGGGDGTPGGQPAGPAADRELAAKLAERTADLQRVTAEYANYRKRVERDRVAVREQALANVLQSLLPVLDDIGRARQHEELTGGFKSVAESLEAITAKLGLDSFGEAGEPFDPNVHEALLHSYSPDVTEPTCVQILQPGYRVGDRILRPARVAVAEPDEAGGTSSGPPEVPAEHD
jgi:molecular chaperone GrpE